MTTVLLNSVNYHGSLNSDMPDRDLFFRGLKALTSALVRYGIDVNADRWIADNFDKFLVDDLRLLPELSSFNVYGDHLISLIIMIDVYLLRPIGRRIHSRPMVFQVNKYEDYVLVTSYESHMLRYSYMGPGIFWKFLIPLDTDLIEKNAGKNITSPDFDFDSYFEEADLKKLWMKMDL